MARTGLTRMILDGSRVGVFGWRRKSSIQQSIIVSSVNWSTTSSKLPVSSQHESYLSALAPSLSRVNRYSTSLRVPRGSRTSSISTINSFARATTGTSICLPKSISFPSIPSLIARHLFSAINELRQARHDWFRLRSLISFATTDWIKAAMAITANDAANSNYDNDPTSESEGQVGIYNGQQYVVVDVS